MQARHQGGYDRFSREKYQALAEEGRAAALALRDGVARGGDWLARWHRQRPAGYSHLRRLLAAVLLATVE